MILQWILALAIILFVNWCYGIYTKNKLLSSIPGPPPIPFLGYRLPNTTGGFHQMFTDLTNKYGKTFKMYIGPNLYVFTYDTKLLEAIMSSNVHLNKSTVYDLMRPWLKNGLIISPAEYWKPRRKIVSPSFHFNIMKDFFKIFKHASNDLKKNLKKEADTGKVINIVEYIQRCSLDIICQSIVGVRLNFNDDESKEFIKAINDMCHIAFERNFSMWKRFDLLYRLFGKHYHDAQKSIKVIDEFTMKAVKRKRAEVEAGIVKSSNSTENKYSKNEILLDALFEHPNLSDEDIQEELINFMFAGYDTTSITVSFCIENLAQYPNIQKKLYDEIISVTQNNFDILTSQNLQEMKYLDQFFKESIRMHSTIPLIERKFYEDAVIEGIFFPKGTTLTMLLYWLHHDKDVYTDPETFNIDRFNLENEQRKPKFSFLPFSAGPRNCVGQKFALMELKTLLVRIVSEFVIQPVEGFKYELGLAAMLVSKHGFPVRLQSRSS